MIGLSRGLFYSGAAAVMLSLWQVADESTSYLMENFYWHFVKNRQTKTRALQLAMQAVKAKKEYAHPYYWAPFVVMGDWR
ncbi:MAG: CHAT domain-containing protein [Thermodesulfobacteriota bacterium]|nr:CHAT domain-containing protein [Thermodesulfobacteriota bacterium]